jgi:GT2 family glycosyltransferase
LALTVPISVVIPACERTEPLLKTLAKITACRPQPSEIVVHVDGARAEVVKAVERAFPAARLLSSNHHLGAGGSRNILVRAAHHELVANFDDDSFPEQPDYFAQVIELAGQFPQAAVLSAANHDDPVQESRFSRVSEASGCGCIFRKSWFMKVGGFVPLPVAYNMEEVDMGLRLHAMGGVIVRDSQLRVVHDKPPPEFIDAATNAAILMNTALFPYLRFPVWLWPVAVWQIVSRLRFLYKRGWARGIKAGICGMPSYLLAHRHRREALPTLAVVSWLSLRRFPGRMEAGRPPSLGV